MSSGGYDNDKAYYANSVKNESAAGVIVGKGLSTIQHLLFPGAAGSSVTTRATRSMNGRRSLTGGNGNEVSPILNISPSNPKPQNQAHQQQPAFSAKTIAPPVIPMVERQKFTLKIRLNPSQQPLKISSNVTNAPVIPVNTTAIIPVVGPKKRGRKRKIPLVVVSEKCNLLDAAAPPLTVPTPAEPPKTPFLPPPVLFGNEFQMELNLLPLPFDLEPSPTPCLFYQPPSYFKSNSNLVLRELAEPLTESEPEVEVEEELIEEIEMDHDTEITMSPTSLSPPTRKDEANSPETSHSSNPDPLTASSSSAALCLFPNPVESTINIQLEDHDEGTSNPQNNNINNTIADIDELVVDDSLATLINRIPDPPPTLLPDPPSLNGQNILLPLLDDTSSAPSSMTTTPKTLVDRFPKIVLKRVLPHSVTVQQPLLPKSSDQVILESPSKKPRTRIGASCISGQFEPPNNRELDDGEFSLKKRDGMAAVKTGYDMIPLLPMGQCGDKPSSPSIRESYNSATKPSLPETTLQTFAMVMLLQQLGMSSSSTSSSL